VSGFAFSRYLMEMVISGLFVLLSTGFSRWMIELFPPKFIGGIFEKTRTIWKQSTHKIKRQDL